MTGQADGTNRNGVVLIHGAWHDHHTWDAVVPLLEAEGRIVRAIDLPGAGSGAARPASFDVRPLDPAAFGTELSPNAGVTQDERTQAAIDAVRTVNSQTGGKAVVLGHSLGGYAIPLLWTADFMLDDKAGGGDAYVLGEINASCVGFSTHLELADQVAEEVVGFIQAEDIVNKRWPAYRV